MKIAVLISGGVDSSVALQLLKNQGHELTAFYLKIWLEDELSFLGHCPWEEDLQYVRAVCEKLNVKLEVISLQKEYHEQVVSYTIAEIQAGRTPNPDILCNQRIKFGLFYDYLDTPFDAIATGHYAQVKHEKGQSYLLRAPDPIKDQTYFLSRLSQAQLQKALFPIGHLTKERVRALAHEYDLPTKSRKDSQGICFLGQFKFNEFVKAHLGENPGPLVEYETGKLLGTHKGFWFHTIGQRQGSGLAGGPWYVVAKNPAHNEVVLSRHYYSSDKQRNQFAVDQLHWFAEKRPEKTTMQVKIRHGKQFHTGDIAYLSQTHVMVTLRDHDQGIAPGQFAVFYDDQECVGSGIIRV